jgi:uncharacterized membrane protein
MVRRTGALATVGVLPSAMLLLASATPAAATPIPVRTLAHLRTAVRDLGALGAFEDLLPNRINDVGVIVGYGTVAGTTHTFTFDTTTETFTDLNAVFGGEQSFALDINDAGLVAGAVRTEPSALDAVVVDPATGTVKPIGGLPGQARSVGIALNDAGLVAGASADSGSPLFGDGFVFDLGTEAKTAIPTADGITRTAPRALNDAGVVVGGVGSASIAYAYDTSTKIMRNLGALTGDSEYRRRTLGHRGRGRHGAPGLHRLTAAPGPSRPEPALCERLAPCLTASPGPGT